MFDWLFNRRKKQITQAVSEAVMPKPAEIAEIERKYGGVGVAKVRRELEDRRDKLDAERDLARRRQAERDASDRRRRDEEDRQRQRREDDARRRREEDDSWATNPINPASPAYMAQNIALFSDNTPSKHYSSGGHHHRDESPAPSHSHHHSGGGSGHSHSHSHDSGSSHSSSHSYDSGGSSSSYDSGSSSSSSFD